MLVGARWSLYYYKKEKLIPSTWINPRWSISCADGVEVLGAETKVCSALCAMRHLTLKKVAPTFISCIFHSTITSHSTYISFKFFTLFVIVKPITISNEVFSLFILVLVFLHSYS